MGDAALLARLQREADCLILDIGIVYLESEEQYQAALLALLHPSKRQEENIEKQVVELGWYQQELRKLSQSDIKLTRLPRE